jgi:DNA end-binding protein Ku
MRYADELIDPGDVEVDEPSRQPTKQAVEMEAKLTKGLRRRFTPDQYSDEYRARVLDFLKRKAKGEDVELPDDEAPEATGDDLAAALEASVKAARG